MKAAITLTVALLALLFTAVQDDAFGYTYWGPKWQTYQIPVDMEANQAGTPDCSGLTEFGSAKQAGRTWNAVSGSYFAFSLGPGHPNNRTAPVYDGVNNLVWKYDSDSFLAATYLWYSGNTRYECDTVMNTRYNWSCTGGQYDVQTVVLHEIGHTLGLGHSSYSAAVMYAYYQGVRRTLHSDDQNGIRSLYPTSGLTKKDIELKVQLLDGFDDF